VKLLSIFRINIQMVSLMKRHNARMMETMVKNPFEVLNMTWELSTNFILTADGMAILFYVINNENYESRIKMLDSNYSMIQHVCNIS